MDVWYVCDLLFSHIQTSSGGRLSFSLFLYVGVPEAEIQILCPALATDTLLAKCGREPLDEKDSSLPSGEKKKKKSIGIQPAIKEEIL